MDAQQQCKLFVGSLSFDTDEDGLREFFSDCGVIEDVFLPTDRYSGRKRGFGFVTFADANAAAAGVAVSCQGPNGFGWAHTHHQRASLVLNGSKSLISRALSLNLFDSFIL